MCFYSQFLLIEFREYYALWTVLFMEDYMIKTKKIAILSKKILTHPNNIRFTSGLEPQQFMPVLLSPRKGKYELYQFIVDS